jgi:DNA-binding IclR family transcriptional regulator
MEGRVKTRSGAASPKPEEAGSSVSALERGFLVLHCFEAGVGALTHQQIVRKTGLPKATVSRITQTLVHLGYLEGGHEDGRYRLTARTLEVGHAYLANVDVRSVARPLMRELVERTRATVNLSVRSADHLVVVETMRSEGAVVSVNLSIGFQFPILQTAIGRAYLAGLPEDQRKQLVQSLRSSAAAHEWKALQERVATAVRECETSGFCSLRGEWRLGVNSVAVPIHADDLYVLNCAGPAPLFNPATMKREIGPRLVEIARQIEKEVNVSWRQA